MHHGADLAELHCHLDGSLRLETLTELLALQGRELPADPWFHDGIGLEGALACFELTLSVLQSPDPVCRVAREMCEDAAAIGVTALEIRFAPQLHTAGGAALEEIVDAAADGCGGRASLILCGLYGEDPAIFDRFLEVARSRRSVVGIDLAGGPATGHRFALEDYAEAFGRARDLGLGRTVHAGEGRPAAEIGGAIERLHAQRIGHGTTLLDDPAVLDLVLEREVVIEACPTSNVHTGAIAAVTEHPLPEWLRRGVRACVNADNTLFSRTDTVREYEAARAIPGMTDSLLAQAQEWGRRGAFRR